MVYITVLISGNGTNLQAIIDACQNGTGILPRAYVNGVISNKKSAYGLIRAMEAEIPAIYVPFKRQTISRSEYEMEILRHIRALPHATDIVVLAGWMHILGEEFLSQIGLPIINLHPALPGRFPGKDAIGQAFAAYQEDNTRNVTGCMVHRVIPEIDAGETLASTKVPIFPTDTLDTLRERVQYFEKPTLIHALLKIIHELPVPPHDSPHDSPSITDQSDGPDLPDRPKLVYKGKVRDIYALPGVRLEIVSSNRFSSFDRHITDIPHKGSVLTGISAWWFERTKDIIPNHMISYHENRMVVKRCKPFMIEVVVRGYITGSTSTSLWTHYARGERTYCGLTFPDGLKKHQRLSEPGVTPTTKDAHDEPISPAEIVARGLATEEEWRYISEKALELFRFGQKQAAERGLLLVDTKFEFGREMEAGTESKILLIDEVLTCDSSRYWKADTYQERLEEGLDPERMDKDIIREWLKARCDPYDTSCSLPVIPDPLRAYVESVYLKFYQTLTGLPLTTDH